VAEATTTDTAHSNGGHHHSTKSYFVVWVILLACTVLTVVTGYMDLGKVNLPLALTIATFKASLVVWYFMHMRDAAGTNRIVFVTSFVFMFVMIIGVFGDLWTRHEMSLPSPAAAAGIESSEIQVPEGAGVPEHHE
jgi:cytochrome c oxidase subunit 4